jgi:hypothetical protein
MFYLCSLLSFLFRSSHMNVARIYKAAVDRVAVGAPDNVLHAVRRLFADAQKVCFGQGGM